MVIIPLINTGKYVMLDDEDFTLVTRYKWYLNSNNGINYAITGTLLCDRISMHRLLLHPPKGYVIDHIDRNGLNNQRVNLRIASRSQNAMNSKISIRNTSGYKGVSYIKSRKKWMASIRVDGKSLSLGYYEDVRDAKEAYDIAAKTFFGEFARLK